MKYNTPNIKIKIIIFIALLFLIINTTPVFADNWVCYDSTYDCHVTAATLRANFPWQPHSPLNKICSGSSQTSTYTPTAFIRPCETPTFSSCPENEYYMRTTFSCIRQCISFGGAHHTYNYYENGELAVACGLGGGPYCNSWSTSENCNEEPKKDYVCGNETNNINNSWEPMTAPSWECPSCKELSIRQTEEPILFDSDASSFQSISMLNGPHRSNTTTDFTFTAYIEACINRVPILNLNIKLINNSGESESSITGIYAKHDELNYSTENLGLLESFIIPEQDRFRKNYTLNAKLNAYRPWAWRQRLITAIPQVVEANTLEIPGYPAEGDTMAQTIGDLYFSSDFLGGQAGYNEIDDTCNAEIMLTNTYEINVLHNIPQLSGNVMCDITDLTNYIEDDTYGITQELTDHIKTEYSLETLKSINNIILKEPENIFITYSLDQMIFNVQDYEFNDNTEFINHINTYSNDAELYQYLKNENIITDEILQQKSEEQLNTLVNKEEIGCNDYEYQFIDHIDDESINNINIQKTYGDLISHTYTLDILHNLTKHDDNYMCTISDLNNYYDDEGITTSLSDELHSLYDLDNWDIIESMTIDTPMNTQITINLDNINNFDVTTIGYDNSTVFKDYTDTLTDEALFQYLRNQEIITDIELQQKSDDSISAIINLDEIGCNSYTYNYGSYTINGNINVNIIDNDHIDINMPNSDTAWINDIITNITLEIKEDIFIELQITEINSTWINDIITNIEVDITNEYDCESSWSWGNLAELDKVAFAKCLYNWDACILNEIIGEEDRGWPYYEVADCGMGPPSNLLDTTLKDAAKGSKTITTEITVYKTCTDGINWLSSEETHACIDGHTYKCNFDLSNDVISAGLDVTKVNAGYVQVSQEKAYLCQENGNWRLMGCDAESYNGTDDEDQSCLNRGIRQGMCGSVDNIYKWQDSPDESPDSCCCTSNGFWDETQGCCDTGDEWTSSDGKWICRNGIVSGDYTGNYCDTTLNPLPPTIIFTTMCDEQEIDGIKKWWNNTDWVTLAPEQCGCTQNSDCNTINGESCLENICMIVKTPMLNFIPYSTINILLGNTEEIILDIRNDMDITDNIELNIDTNYDISNWAWFKGQKNLNQHTKQIVIPANSNVKVIIEIIGSKTGAYTLNIDSDSLFTLMSSTIDANIRIIPQTSNTESLNGENTGKVETTTTPGLSWIGFIFIMMLGSIILYRKDKF